MMTKNELELKLALLNMKLSHYKVELYREFVEEISLGELLFPANDTWYDLNHCPYRISYKPSATGYDIEFDKNRNSDSSSTVINFNELAFTIDSLDDIEIIVEILRRYKYKVKETLDTLERKVTVLVGSDNTKELFV